VGQEIEVEPALREALSNAVVHGNGMDTDNWVHVRYSCDTSIVARHRGRGFHR
jgi:anti-sigma regulatory factor (Ser/Thr protein kinase)